MIKSRWFAIRSFPGYQRMASYDERLPEARRYESVLERNCRDEGFEVFMPSYLVENKHHRTNQIIVKRFPLLVGYAFINLHRLNFEELRAVEGVMCLLKINRDLGPIEFNEEIISGLMFAEWEATQQFIFERKVREEHDRVNRVRHLRGQLRKIMPKGRGARLSMTLQADQAIDSLNAPTKEKVIHILNELRGLTEGDGVDSVREAV